MESQPNQHYNKTEGVMGHDGNEVHKGECP